MRVKSLVFVTMLLMTPVVAGAQSWVIQGADRYFRVESEAKQGRRGPIVLGYVYNTSAQTVDRVRLIVEGLDGTGQVASTTVTQVMGTIPGDDRAYFEVPVPAAATYRVRVGSFEPIGRGQ